MGKSTKKNKSMKGITILVFISAAVFSILTSSTATDTISANQQVRDGDTIVSAGETFALGFFRPGNSTNRYVGIWYNKISAKTVVWVANREIPLTDTSGLLTIDHQGILVLQNATKGIIWSSNSSVSTRNPVARLLDTGNLVIMEDTDNNQETIIWQSFDYPGDTLLAGMKFGKDLVSGIERHLTSWKSEDDPSSGEYTVQVDTHGYPVMIQRRGSVVQYRQGPWNGVTWSGLTNLRSNSIYSYEFVFNEREIFYRYELLNASAISQFIMKPDGKFVRLTWIDRTQEWNLLASFVTDNCVRYRLCGAYGSCNIENSPACGCLRGFEPRRPDEWNVTDWSSGCRRSKALECENGDGFRKYSGLKLPDTREAWYNNTMNLEECKRACLNNCSCTAYANMDIRSGGSGCLLWFHDLVDMRDMSDGGQDIYIRLAKAEIEKDSSSSMNRRAIITVSILAVVTIVLGLCLWQLFNRRKLAKEGNLGKGSKVDDYNNENENGNVELPLLSLSTLLIATENYSNDHKLGEGGFGPVYKGRLSTGQEIAVKRLSKDSGQGLQEFKNEILLICKLQHRNLVRILGHCLEGEERMLVYEYLPNKSLDSFIFDKDRRTLLTWECRYKIALGIAKGLQYLHHDSRLRIIHRDLKASNVLLDSELNPKISDFGIARILRGDQSEGKTKCVIGTYGYMSPEYTIHGKFSVKSDVYSFGVLLIELVSGEKNTKYRHPDHHHSLLGHAWLLWNTGKAMELADNCLKDSLIESQVLRCIQVGLLCIQQLPKDRPTMSFVILMLSNEDVELPQPKPPGFFIERNSIIEDRSSDVSNPHSENRVTLTMLEAR